MGECHSGGKQLSPNDHVFQLLPSKNCLTGLKSHESTLLNETRLGVTKTTIYRSNFCEHYIPSHQKTLSFWPNSLHKLNLYYLAKVWEKPITKFNKKCSTEFSKNTYCRTIIFTITYLTLSPSCVEEAGANPPTHA